MSSRELLLACLRGEPTPRPPVICGGGMMSFAIAEAMDACGCYWPEAHHEADAMAKLALATQQASGFDAVAVPFCMTIEAEELGADIHFGSRDVQPRVLAEPMREVRDLAALQSPSEKPGPRRQVTLQAIRLLRERAPEVAVLGATVGPFSLAGQVLEAGLLLRAVRRDPAAVHDLLRRCAPVVADFARSQVEAGADAIVISDPTATGELLGAKAYAEFAGPYLRQAVAAVREAGAPAIVHVCGCPNTILGHLADLEVAAVSVDETASLPRARAALRRQRLMGNISAELLRAGAPEAIAANARRALDMGVDILAPACGVIARTPAAHLRVLAEVAAAPR
ncbi:MAG: MtaA/CmuA family methyltransferase [Armatimonadetes bacterium]|nr:MtaA/CmuA family methyltransferase [Armatimonadota bacterium]